MFYGYHVCGDKVRNPSFSLVPLERRQASQPTVFLPYTMSHVTSPTTKWEPEDARLVPALLCVAAVGTKTRKKLPPKGAPQHVVAGCTVRGVVLTRTKLSLELLASHPFTPRNSWGDIRESRVGVELRLGGWLVLTPIPRKNKKKGEGESTAIVSWSGLLQCRAEALPG